ncbi:flagellar biosynthetic protein FliR, partial [Thiohalorhabdus sp.]|uniref:flagellar biosynthetic protein FliR n=1 Tax=Thiohalorhabdus sp. TaxID=3094134 RepID=UPI002FC2B27B
APLFSNEAINARVQILLGLALAFALYPLVREHVPDLTVTNNLAMAVLMIQEVLLGAIMGFAFTLLLGAVQLAGQAMGFTMGMALANVFDPATNSQINVLAQFYTFFAIVLFVAVDGHYLFLRLLVESFQQVAPGQMALGDAGARAVMESGGHMFALGVRLALPVLLTLMTVYAAAGVMSRAAPQIQVFFVLHPLNIALGLFMFSAMLGVSAGVLQEEFRSFVERSLGLLRVLGG